MARKPLIDLTQAKNEGQMQEEMSQILGVLGGLKSSVDALVSGQSQLFDLTREAHGRTATLEANRIDSDRRLERVEEVQGKHANELAESRGASKANRWLAITMPPIVLAVFEGIKLLFSHPPTH
jgi:hypothetical protein